VPAETWVTFPMYLPHIGRTMRAVTQARDMPMFLFDRPFAAVFAALASSGVFALVDFLLRHVA
jgi:hypothetical protein